MKSLIGSLLLVGASLFTNTLSAQSNSKNEYLYVGTYSAKGEGIYVYKYERAAKKFSPIQVLTHKNSPSFLEFHPTKKYLYSSNEGNGTVSSYRINQQTGTIEEMNTKPAQGNGPCHVSVSPQGNYLYVSNYGSGNLAVYAINADGQIGELIDTRQHKGAEGQKPRMHSIIPSKDGKFIYASDLGIDQVATYQVDAKTGKLSEPVPHATVTKGDGPRHLTLHPNGNFAYSAGELHNVINSFAVNKKTGALTALERVSMLPEGFEGKSYAADIHFTPDGKYLYASNRGHESLVVYQVNAKTGKLTTQGHVPTKGKHPRNFMIDPKGEFVLVANRDNNNVVFFTTNASSGLITPTGYELEIPTPVCVKLLTID